MEFVMRRSPLKVMSAFTPESGRTGQKAKIEAVNAKWVEFCRRSKYRRRVSIRPGPFHKRTFALQ
jgi:hypothetical protein